MSEDLEKSKIKNEGVLERTFSTETMDGQIATLNLGPTHPATHGIFQNILKVDGEKILSAEPTVGYIHRAFEKMAERKSFQQITTLTDRLNYCSSPLNNIGWQMTVEKLCGIEIPKRVQYMRVIIMELARIADHLICNSVIGVDTGGLTGFTWMFIERERIYDMYEQICGTRLTTNIGRIGGFERDLNDKFHALIQDFLNTFLKRFEEYNALLDRNRIFMDRTIGVGKISAERALSYGFVGPNLRATGIDYDVRVHSPYCSYEDFDFDIPVGTEGDTYDRFQVRQEEVRQSIRIIKQAYENLPKEGVYHADTPLFYLPPKENVYNTIEGMINHFKQVYGEMPYPVGEVYHSIEGGNGELGYYLISDGGRSPYRLQFRRPCFIYYQAYPEMIKGQVLSDAVITLSSLNVIAGELDA
ncbi:MAG TPA: NADH-quinone oxidoreductase subunit D [Taishania sp.]|nr:NADH-quinone oxidoreductase subunit D [Taishania sp.]